MRKYIDVIFMKCLSMCMLQPSLKARILLQSWTVKLDSIIDVKPPYIPPYFTPR